jgi:hypothetical protein
MSKAIFAMGFVIVDVRPSLPSVSVIVSAEDQRLMFELLKGDLCLEVSAIATIDLDDHIFGSQTRFYQGMPVAVSGGVMSHIYRSHWLRPSS